MLIIFRSFKKELPEYYSLPVKVFLETFCIWSLLASTRIFKRNLVESIFLANKTWVYSDMHVFTPKI